MGAVSNADASFAAAAVACSNIQWNVVFVSCAFLGAATAVVATVVAFVLTSAADRDTVSFAVVQLLRPICSLRRHTEHDQQQYL